MDGLKGPVSPEELAEATRRGRAALLRRSLHNSDMDDELAAKRSENRIAAEVDAKAEGPVRAMIRRLRRLRFP